MEDREWADRMDALELPIPADHSRGRCPAIIHCQESHWHNLDTWLGTANWRDITQIGPDDVSPARSNLLAALARYKGPADFDCPVYARATADVVEVFAMKNLLELKSGKNIEPALCMAAGCGNYHVCTLLLEAGASTPSPGYSKLRPSRLFLGGRGGGSL